MKQKLLTIIVFLSLLSCNAQSPDMKDKYLNLDKFSERIHSLNDSLGKKYGIKEYGFDVECIYGKEDLTRLVSEMLDLANFKYEVVKDSLDKSNNQYFSLFKITETEYEFRTSSLGDYVDLETVMPELDSITKNETPEYQYNFSNADGGQIAFLIYAKTDSLKMAIEEGYPCSLPNSSFKREVDWNWGTYSIVSLNHLPKFDDLLNQYHTILSEIYDLGYDVPNLTIDRIYIDDIFKSNSIDIYIDGGPMSTSSNDYSGNEVKCFWDGSGLVLGYTLVKVYQGEVKLYDKKAKTETMIEADEYFNSVLKAFGKRKK